MSKVIIIELDKCRECEECTASCSYPWRDGNGVTRLLEMAACEVVCRKCELRSCVEVCPNEALREQDDGTIKRYNMRCTGCYSCSHACPFGNIRPAAFPFLDSVCDYCVGRQDGEPACVGSCPLDAIRMEEVSADAPDLHFLNENLAVRTVAWRKLEPVGEE